MKIYFASRYSQQAYLQEIKQAIWETGHEVVSTWIDESPNHDMDKLAPEERKKIAMRDLCQISSADLLILDTLLPLSEGSGGGREFEAGFAFAAFQNKHFWRVGPAYNPFHDLADREFAGWDQVISTLGDKNV